MGKKKVESLKMAVKSFAELRTMIHDYHEGIKPRLPLPGDMDYYNGFSFPVSELELLIRQVPKTERVFFSFCFHKVGKHGLPDKSFSLVASPMLKENGKWVVKANFTSYDYCLPCPTECPTFEENVNGQIVSHDIRDL